MLITNASTEPTGVRRYFDSRGWTSEPRGHAEVTQALYPDVGWRIVIGRKKISRDWLITAQADGVTAVTLRVRYSDRRQVTADFTITELLQGG